MLAVAPGLTHESGPRRDALWAPGRVAILAHYSTLPEVSRSVVAMLTALDEAGYATVLVSAAQADGRLLRTCSWAPGQPSLPEGTSVVRRANVGHDFGSWAAALAAWPALSDAHRLLLVNDSLVGPFTALDPLLDDFEAASAPLWGLVESRQHRRHLQSFFLGFRDGVLADPRLRAFWDQVRVEPRRTKVLRYGELGLAETEQEAGLSWSALHPAAEGSSANPTLTAWADLLGPTFPFLKRSLLHGSPAAELERVAAVVADVLQVDLSAWLGPEDHHVPRGPSHVRGRLVALRHALDIDGPRRVLQRGVGRAVR